MFSNIKKHKDLYEVSWLATIAVTFCSYYVVAYFIPISLLVYIIISLIIVTLSIFSYYLYQSNLAAKELFKTIIETDDKGLYIKLTNELGIELGEYIYYKNKAKYHKIGSSRKYNDLRYLLKEFRLKAR